MTSSMTIQWTFRWIEKRFGTVLSGSGIHTCIGLHLARMELHIFFETWFREIGKFELTPDKPAGAMRGGVVWAIEDLWLDWDAGQGQ